jgi:hypothetical protein
MHGYEVYQKRGDDNWQRMQMTRDQMNNFFKLMETAGFKEA